MELTKNLHTWEEQFDEEGLLELHRITTQIKQSPELQEILAATVSEVRSFLKTDRVVVYRFDTNGSGEVIAESIHEERLPSLLGLHFGADDIPPGVRNMFLWARQRSIVDVASGFIGLSQLASPETGNSLPKENIYYREVDPCHIEYLKAMGVQSSVVVPILEYSSTEQSAKPQLWGLLISHHSEARTVLHRELQVVQLFVDQLAMAIAQTHLLTRIRAAQQQEAIVNQITNLLHPLSTNQLQTALEVTIAAIDGVGGRLYIEQSAELYSWGEQPRQVIEQHPVWQEWIAECQNGDIKATSDIYKEPSCQALAPFFQSTQIRGLLAIPLSYDNHFIGVLSIFRSEVETEILWAGRRELDEQQQNQISFEPWLEQKKEQAPEWKPEEITLAQALATQFSIAIQQQQVYQQVQTLNANLEHQVQERTSQLQQSLDQALVVKQVTDQIRSNLDYNITLQTIVKEVRQLLKADRVLIYKLHRDGGGEVIVEDVDIYWRSVLGQQMPQECFPDEYARLYFRGRVRAINNTSTAELDPCHQEFLQSLQIKANLIVPINISTQLWGLLIAHQCYAPRNWQDAEIDLLQQLADEAAIAIQQAQLYEKSRNAESTARAQAGQVTQLLHQMQQTQTKLIQTEKMSSFGLLALGAAHEINNSVNFICTKLSQASDYTQNLLELLDLYRLSYPQPNSEISYQAQAVNLDFLTQDLPQIMSSMKVQADRVRSTVQSFRNFSRLDQASTTPVDLNEGLDRALLILQRRLQSKVGSPGIKVIKDYGDLPLVECYAGQVNQVFMNILSYAIDALTEEIGEVGKVGEEMITTPSPSIRISTGVSSDHFRAVIRIAYNDLGMTQDIQKSIFDPVFMTKPLEKSTGMELAISYQIVVQKHGGVLNCVSEPEQGTEFWIEIPFKQTVSD
ncbi:GAF domain-containing protein [Nostocales cyanobacterium HT-58-2]|nr:GAF domain-containing protein [Nostocales cyanobacterium HT-58-2]